MRKQQHRRLYFLSYFLWTDTLLPFLLELRVHRIADVVVGPPHLQYMLLSVLLFFKEWRHLSNSHYIMESRHYSSSG
nr:hypothetical protein Q903MT_gene6201 [Picea sitchensis]